MAMSWRSESSPLPAETNPRAVFERLFGDDESTDTGTRRERLASDKSVLDYVSGSLSRLQRRVGAGDRRKLDEYLESVRDIERRIQVTEQDKATMQVNSEPAEWTIDVSTRPENTAAVIVAELDASLELFHTTVVARPEKDSGIIRLPAKYAATHGSKLRFEPQPHKNTVGYWSDEHDTAEWTFQNAAAGEYEIDILQGCGKGHGGSKVTLLVADQTLDFVVEETGHFQNFIWRTLGSVTLKASDAEEAMTLKLTPKSKPGGAVMDVRAIRLCPKGSERTFEPELADAKLLPSKE